MSDHDDCELQQLKKDKDEHAYAGINKFLNRLLAVPVAVQARIFAFFHALLVSNLGRGQGSP